MQIFGRLKVHILEKFEKWLTKVTIENLPAVHQYDHLMDEPPTITVTDHMTY